MKQVTDVSKLVETHLYTQLVSGLYSCTFLIPIKYHGIFPEHHISPWKIWFDPPSDCVFFPVLPQGRSWGASFEMKRGERCQVTSGAQWCREPQLGLEALEALEALAVPEAGPLGKSGGFQWDFNGFVGRMKCKWGSTWCKVLDYLFRRRWMLMTDR